MNKFNIEKTKLSKVLKITPPTIFNDFRGNYIETYNEELYKKNGINVNFVQSDESGIFIRTYERGVESETLSCGTGVVAAVLSLFLSNKLLTKNDIIVNAKGGSLKVSYEYDTLKKMFYNIEINFFNH